MIVFTEYFIIYSYFKERDCCFYIKAKKYANKIYPKLIGYKRVTFMKDNFLIKSIIAVFFYFYLSVSSQDTLRIMALNIWQDASSVSNGLVKVRDVIAKANPDIIGFGEVRNYSGDWTTTKKLIDNGFTDAFREFFPDEVKKSWNHLAFICP